MNSSSTTSARVSMLTFTLGSSTCGIPVGNVVTVFQKGKIIALPRPRPAIEGMIQHQSRLVPLLDLETLLGGQKSERNFIVVIEQSGLWFAILTSDVGAVTEVEMDQIHHPHPGDCALPSGYIRATVHGDDRQCVLNLEAIGKYLHQG